MLDDAATHSSVPVKNLEGHRAPLAFNQGVKGWNPFGLTKNYGLGYQKGYRDFPFGLGEMLPFSPSSIPA